MYARIIHIYSTENTSNSFSENAGGNQYVVIFQYGYLLVPFLFQIQGDDAQGFPANRYIQQMIRDKHEIEQLKGDNRQWQGERLQLQEEKHQLEEDNQQLLTEMHQLQEDKEELRRDKVGLIQEKGQLFKENQHLIGEKEQLTEEKEHVVADKEELTEENEQLREENEQLKEEKEQLSEEKENLTAEKEQLQRVNQTLQEGNQQLQEDKQKLQNEKQHLQEVNQQFQRDIKTLQSEKQKLQEDKQKLQGEKQHLQEVGQQLQRYNITLQGEKHKLQEDKQQLIADKELLIEENEQLQGEKQHLQEVGQQLQRYNITLQGETQKLQEDKQQLIADKELLIEENEQLRVENEQLREEKEQLSEEKKNLTAEKEQLQRVSHKLQEDKQQLQEDKQKLQGEKQHLQEVNQQFQRDIKTLQSEKLKLQEDKQKLQGEKQYLQEVGQQLQRDNITLQGEKQKLQEEKQQLIADKELLIEAMQELEEALVEALEVKPCLKHQLPLKMFCDEPDCQEILCETCVLLKHSSGHKTMQALDKIKELNEELKKYKDDLNNWKAKFSQKILNMNEIQHEIDTTISQQLHKLHKTNEIAVQESELWKFHQTQLLNSRDVLEDLSEKENSAENKITEITQLMAENDLHKLMSNKRIIQNIYHETIETRRTIREWLSSYITVDLNPYTSDMDKYPSMGNTILTAYKRCKELAGMQMLDMLPTLNPKLEKTWEADGYLLTTSPSGMVYTGERGGTKIQAFDLSGNQKMVNFVPGSLNAMAVISSPWDGRDILVLGSGKDISIAEGWSVESCTGVILDTLSLRGFKTHHSGIFQYSANSVLVSGKQGEKCILLQCIIREGKIILGDKHFVLPRQDLHSLTLVDMKKKVIFAICDDYKSVVSIDLEKEPLLAKITAFPTEAFFCPCSIGTDGERYLFTAVENGYRILVKDLVQDKLEREIVTGTTGKSRMSCIPNRNKLIVTISPTNHPFIQVYVWDLGPL